MIRRIFFEHFLVGEIDTAEADATFRYDPRWLATRGAFPLSLSMPLGAESYGPGIIIPWLANLLPEDRILVQAGRALGLSPGDVLGLLDRMGGDLAGALSIGRARARTQGGEYRDIPDAASLERIIEELPARPFLVGEEGISMSLAGGQAKLGVAMHGSQLAIPVAGTPSTLILKPDNERLWGGIHNEAFCLVLATLAGLDAVPSVTTGVAGRRPYLLVGRYDRASPPGRPPTRLHQEDFCQALGRAPAQKYERGTGGGIRAADMFELVRTQLRPREPIRLLDHFVFNVLVCNTDAHAKNYSILLSGPEALTVSPLYDVVCAEVWDNITRNLAQSIAGKTRGDHIYRRHWMRFARECGLGPAQVARRADVLARRVLDRLDAAHEGVEAMPAGSHPILRHVRRAIEARCRTVLANLQTGPAGDDDEGEVDGPPQTPGFPGPVS